MPEILTQSAVFVYLINYYLPYLLSAAAFGFDLNILEELDEMAHDVAHRTARLHRFNPTKYHVLVEKGLRVAL
jgi:hypothetical protein